MSRRTDRRGRERDAERRYQHAAAVASAERLRRRDAERERNDALDRAEHAEREAARMHELNIATLNSLSYEEYGRIGKEPDGTT